uniref:Uncharacterized protein n=1 Tax=mine drainage metagenome TaxID=410659 RepID=E6QBA3_9ZZZZ
MDNPKIKTPCPCSKFFSSPTGAKLVVFASIVTITYIVARCLWTLAIYHEYMLAIILQVIWVVFAVLVIYRITLYNTNRDFIACIKCTVLRFNPFHTKPSGPREDEQLNNGLGEDEAAGRGGLR